MRISIPRGIVYHSIRQEFNYLIRACFSRLDNQETVCQFEQAFADYHGVKHCIAFSHARVAIYHILDGLKLNKGDEVILPPITIKAMLDVVIQLGLKPVLVDLEEHTLGFEMQQLARAITPKTKVVLSTYLYGMVPDLSNLTKLCQEHGIHLIEDFSQCLNGMYQGKKVGTIGQYGVYSASSIKTLDTFGGGLVVTNDTVMQQHLRQRQSETKTVSRTKLVKAISINLLRNIATNRYVFTCSVFPLLRLLKRVNPNIMQQYTGGRDKAKPVELPREWFTQYTSLQAELGVKLLPRVAEQDTIRIENAEYIRGHIGVQPVSSSYEAKHVYWQNAVYFDNAPEVIQHLQASHVDTATTSLMLLSSLTNYGFRNDMPVAERFYQKAIFLPCYPGLGLNKEIKHIVDTINHLKRQEA